MEDVISKSATLRNNEYYFQQELFDFLYSKSSKGNMFYSLIKYIITDKNIRLA